MIEQEIQELESGTLARIEGAQDLDALEKALQRMRYNRHEVVRRNLISQENLF